MNINPKTLSKKNYIVFKSIDNFKGLNVDYHKNDEPIEEIKSPYQNFFKTKEIEKIVSRTQTPMRIRKKSIIKI